VANERRVVDGSFSCTRYVSMSWYSGRLFMDSESLLTSRSVVLLKSLCSINRIKVLEALKDGSKNVGQLAACGLGCQSGLSRCLHTLHHAGLVSREKKHQQVVYSISPAVRQLCTDLETVAVCVLERQLGIAKGKP
jgi:DNA-binding HxlR family transcriptional regulator